MALDPITAALDLITAITKLVQTIMDGQTPEQRKVIWDWYIEDVTFWRHVLKLDQLGPQEGASPVTIADIFKIITALAPELDEIQGIVHDGLALEKRVKALLDRHPELVKLFESQTP